MLDPIKSMGSLDNPKYPRSRLIDYMLGPKKVLKNKQVKQKDFLRSRKDRFNDYDNDGVISGLDCYPYDGRKHGNDPFFATLDALSPRQQRAAEDKNREEMDQYLNENNGDVNV